MERGVWRGHLGAVGLRQSKGAEEAAVGGCPDILAVLNALRAAFPPKVIHDISEGTLKMAGEALAPA